MTTERKPMMDWRTLYRKEAMNQWDTDCLKWHGRILTGKKSHWCYDWDFMPVDETTKEWPCNCKLD